ncbi:MAG: fructose-6-phosphate aldolase [Proteobacteria bacterium]|nr:fructose-6-phosphate aldolase [Pseudomonadota bacterium]
MKFFIDSANVAEIEKAQELGLVDGVTTNPTLMAREGTDWREIAAGICKITDGPVSLEVFATDAAQMLEEAKELIAFGPNVAIKVPCTDDGLRACRVLSEQGVMVNVTLVFSAMQALLAAKAGATFVSPFVGRLDHIGQIGMDLIEQIVTIFANYDFNTQVLVASIRNPTHVLDAALMGAHVCTIPYNVMLDLLKHPLTEKGLATFVADAAKLS